MSITPQNARKEMLALVDAQWADAETIVGVLPELRFQGIEEPSLPGAGKFWARVGTTNVTTYQIGHQANQPGVSQPVFRTEGFITLQIFAPMNSLQSWEKGELLSELAQRMFMGTETPGSVWFRNPRIRNLDNDGTWYRWNVLADYQFDQVKGA